VVPYESKVMSLHGSPLKSSAAAPAHTYASAHPARAQVSTLTGKVVQQTDRVQGLWLLPGAVRLALGAMLPTASALVGI